MTLRISTRTRLAAILLAASGGAGAVEQVYLSHTPHGTPVYTNRPVQPGSRLIAVIPAPLHRQAASIAKAPSIAPRAAAARHEMPRPGLGIDALIRLAARTHGIEEALLRAVIHVESGFNPVARSSSGALGLMQLMPGTARRYGVIDARDAAQNISGGARYLKDLLDRFGGSLQLALAAYNAGEGAVIRYGHRIPPFAETQAYVPAVLARYRNYRAQGTQAASRVLACRERT